MPHETTIFRFEHGVPMQDVEQTLHLAKLAVASLHGEDRVRLQVTATINHLRRVCEIDTESEAGQSLALIFGGYVRREFGDSAVDCERVSRLPSPARPKEVLT